MGYRCSCIWRSRIIRYIVVFIRYSHRHSAGFWVFRNLIHKVEKWSEEKHEVQRWRRRKWPPRCLVSALTERVINSTKQTNLHWTNKYMHNGCPSGTTEVRELKSMGPMGIGGICSWWPPVLNPVIVESLLAVDVFFGLSTGLFSSVTDFSLRYDADKVSLALSSTWVLDELISSSRQAELFSSSKPPSSL